MLHYGCVGTAITNKVQYVDGSSIDGLMGGTAYGLEGVRFWTDDCFIVSRNGADFDEYYGEWFDKNKIPREGMTTVCEKGVYNVVEYNADGTYHEHSVVYAPGQAEIMFGMMIPSHVDMLSTAATAKGYYICQGVNDVFWKNVDKLRRQYGFKVMYEILTSDCKAENLEKLKETIACVDMVSLNLPECRDIFGVETEEECIAKLQELDVEYILFRCGEKGLYTIEGDKCTFIPCMRYDGPVQDPTGCGNSSTAAAMWAYCEGYDYITSGIVANVTAHYNVRQYGPCLEMTKELRKEMWDHVKRFRAEYPEV